MINCDGAHLRNPKRGQSSRVGRAAWYPYYAGYSPEFVDDSVDFAELRGSVSRVLDPWNGSGTTTQVAHRRSLHAEGFDLNPAMVIVAKAKNLGSNVSPSLGSLLDDICTKAVSLRDASTDDPLTAWLNARSAGVVRGIERAIFTLLIDRVRSASVAELDSLDHVSSLAAFFYVALFRAVRSAFKSFRGSNPTWIRRPNSHDARIEIPWSEARALFRQSALGMQSGLLEEPLGPETNVTTKIGIANSCSLPVQDASFDIVVSSPPYCTRIDYAVKTGPELAVLGFNEHSFRLLREGMIGTPTICGIQSSPKTEWGRKCGRLLDRIWSNPAKASRSYYWKTYAQYFDGLFQSIREIGRVLSKEGLCFLVFQDSHYKEVHVDLAGIAEEMSTSCGLRQICRKDFLTRRTMAGVNPFARIYNGTPAHTESILVWERVQ